MAYRNCWYRVVFLVLFGLTMRVSTAGAQVSQGDTSARVKKLQDDVDRQGRLPVLVRLSDESILSVKSLAGGGNDPVSNGISIVQQRVLDSLPTKGNQDLSLRQYRYIPFMALEVDPSVLDALLIHSDVAEVLEDEIFESMQSESISLIGAEAAWEYGGTGEGQVVAVLDTGVDYEHPFIADKVVDGGCFTTNYTSVNGNFESISTCPNQEEEAYGIEAGGHCGDGVTGCDHGTRVAGIVAGQDDSFSGVAKDASILSVQVFSRFESYCGESSCARSWASDQIAGLEYIYAMSDSLDIAAVNMSLGGGHYTSQAHCDEVNPAMYAVFALLYEKGIPVIAAAGNSGLSDGLVAPACLSNAISVGSTTIGDRVSTFTNSADFLNFWAPGQDIITSVPGGSFRPGTGTSFAAPHVAGAWAILKSVLNDATIGDVKRALTDTGHQVTDGRSNVSVARIQIDRALQFALLPVELVRFEAVTEAARVDVRWETASERNNAGFELQHSWGEQYYTVAFIPGGGTQEFSQEYSYGIENLPPGKHSFRLKQIDFDGTQTITQSIEAYVALERPYHMGAAYPNPFNPTTQFTLTIAQKQAVRIEVYNLLGARVGVLYDGELDPQEIHVFTVEASHLPSGVYLIQALGEHFKVTRRAMLLK